MAHAELTVFLRAALATFLGFQVGWVRTLLGEPIQARTIALASMTAASLVAMTEAFFPDEIARVVAGIVTGIGFLGAGAILRGTSGEVQGLTTAASLWAMSAIGMAVGSGHELLGVLLTLLICVSMTVSQWPVLTRLARYLARRRAKAAASGSPEKEAPAGQDRPSPQT